MPDVSNLPWMLYPLFFLVALLYSSVGHGGASGYLAVFALFGVASPQIAPVALALNVVVASTGWWRYARSGYFSWRLLSPFVVASVPMAFLTGLVRVPHQLFSFLLGLMLVLAALRMFFLPEVNSASSSNAANGVDRAVSWIWGLLIGCVLGALSGLLGIGGGIFLSPLILFLGWADVKRTAALSSAFIVLNSLGGLAGHSIKGSIPFEQILPLVLVVFAGGFFGSWTGAIKLSPRLLQRVLAVVLVLAGAKLLAAAG